MTDTRLPIPSADYESWGEPGHNYGEPKVGVDYVFGICSCEIGTSREGKPMLVVLCDIAEGEYKNYYAKKSQEISDRLQRQINCRIKCCIVIPEDEEGLHRGLYAHFINCVKSHNVGFVFTGKPSDLVRQKFIGTLGLGKPTGEKQRRYPRIERFKKCEEAKTDNNQANPANIENDLPF
jgi:hypothetical protein